ncbi:putative c-di-GMP phosphodiesterase class II [Vibrio nigripulchritudo MADA3029]|uniref:HD-GYP domain-containing protein n=1 Tax=Vibrio nigripulchritudo TaxID=28173 RepID=UPI0003B20ABD|nr:HD-GYP domain-containing protein [Vibrio nigripulchritudo]CCN49890.1 putative c-di-GMP phosphodiesterase class II [Vibrio nigripulchritudo MADA3020]CCN56467.1 putative c-di-GMP phosphodiesterase class II [Vibrio nigripulchritudo MADA3021]CCN62039.1 putative c-di-GMP phosphodiesterase class II [Vibrio nigripulchritudo MADA3029]
MQYKPENSIKIAIEHLNIGMFVTGIENSERVNLSNAGRVSSQKAITQLADSGVRFAWVDEKLSAKDCVFKPVLDDEPKAEKQDEPEVNAPNKKLPSREIRQNKAKKLIAEAKGLAQKLLNETFEGNTFEVEALEDWADDVIETVLVDSDAIKCVSALRNKDTYLLEHSVNVSCLLVTFGKHLGMDKTLLRELAIGGIIHDVGKIKVDDKVLNKPARLTPEEFEHMKLHQVYAGDIIENVEGLSKVSQDVCLMHHEKLDGNGYPNGLKGDEIPLHGRMSCIVDIYDALTAHRCYKEGMSSAEAFKILLSMTPAQLDQDLVYKFINCIGVYPVGSLVELSDGRVGITWTSNSQQPLKPVVKCFYSRKFKRFIEVSYVDLKNSNVKIEGAISPKDIEVDPAPFYDT